MRRSNLNKVSRSSIKKKGEPIPPEKILLESNEQFKVLVENANVGVSLSKDRETIYANRTLLKMMGYKSFKEYAAKDPVQMAAGETKSLLQNRLQSLRKGIKVPEVFIGTFYTKQGSIKTLEVQAKRVSVNNSYYQMAIAIDLTEKLAMQQKLEETKYVFEKAQKFTKIGSWRWTFSTGELYWSDAYYNIFGVKKQRKIDYDFFLEFVHADDKEKVMQEIRECYHSYKPFHIEYRIQLKNGKVKWIHGDANVFRNRDGKPIEMFGVIRDITEEKKVSEALKSANTLLEQSFSQLKEASSAKENFLSVISHEIRTPLNSVIGLSNLLLRRSPRQDQVQVVKTLKNSADNLMHLVNDILDFNKIKAGKVELEFTNFSFRQFLQHLQSMFSPAAEDKGLIFKVQADPRIPDALEGDVTRLNQIFNNLLSNAIKFTRKGKVNLEANLKSEKDNSCTIAIEVRDSGIGIAPEKINSVFLPFQQSEKDITRKYGGTGLGLSIVKALVQMLNGNISLTSSPGSGSVLLVELPFKIGHHAEQRSLETASAASIIRKKINILYVEDVESNRFLIKSLLSDVGQSCATASSGKSALKMTASKMFDVILMDIQMPKMDGYEATRAIRNQKKGKNNNTPIIAITAEPFSEQLKNKVLAHRIQDVISKPFEPEALLEKIDLFSKQKDENSKFYSFHFYEKAFDYNNTQLIKIKKAVITDLKKFDRNLLQKNKAKNIQGIREEIHKIRPILKNLECNVLIQLLDSFRLHENYTPNLTDIVLDVRKQLNRLLNQILKLKY